MTVPGRRGRYGIDAPYAPAGMLVGTAACAAAAWFAHVSPFWIQTDALPGLATIYLHTRLRGKFIAWRGLLAGMELTQTSASMGIHDRKSVSDAAGYQQLVVPAQAGNQCLSDGMSRALDSRFRGNDEMQLLPNLLTAQ